MKYLIKSLLYIFLLITLTTKAQNLVSFDHKEIEKFRNRDHIGYKDKKGQYYGAGYSIDGYIIVVLFKEAVFNKEANKLTIKGTTYSTLIDSASRLNGVEIFTAKAKGKKLKKRKVLGYSNTSDSKVKKDGDFVVCFKPEKNTNLYFDEGKSYYLLEYNIWDLISTVKSVPN